MKAIKIYQSGIHIGEERIIEGNQSSGMITFTGCHLSCSFCYTPETSRESRGFEVTPEEFQKLSEELVARGARNLNLISPTQVWSALKRPLLQVKLKYGRLLPLILKMSGYESLNCIKEMASLADLLVPDFKVYSEASARSVNLPADYGKIAQEAIASMLKTHGSLHFTESGKLTHGVLVRHLLMPGFLEDSLEVIRALSELNFTGYLNLMTYFVDPAKKTVANANPNEVTWLTLTAEKAGMRVLVNGKPRLETPCSPKQLGEISYA